MLVRILSLTVLSVSLLLGSVCLAQQQELYYLTTAQLETLSETTMNLFQKSTQQLRLLEALSNSSSSYSNSNMILLTRLKDKNLETVSNLQIVAQQINYIEHRKNQWKTRFFLCLGILVLLCTKDLVNIARRFGFL